MRLLFTSDARDYCVQQSVLGPVGAAVPPTALIGEQAPGVGVPENSTAGLETPGPMQVRPLLCTSMPPEQVCSDTALQLAPTGAPQVQAPQVTVPETPE